MAQSILQTKVFTAPSTAPEDGSVSFAFDSNVTAGSTIVVVGGGANEDYDGTTPKITSISDNRGNAYGAITTRQFSAYSPALSFVCAGDAEAGATTFTIGLESDANNTVTFVAIEIGDSAASPLDKIVSAATNDSVSASYSAPTTGALTQADNVLILVGLGWCGYWTASGWTTLYSRNNGVSSQMGMYVGYRIVNSADAVVGTLGHSVGAAARNILVAAIKAGSGGSSTLCYRFELDATKFTSADTGITGFVWRNLNPDQGAAQRFTGLSGDATAGKLTIPSGSLPGGVALGDTIYGIFYNGADTSGIVQGSVEEE